MAFDVEVTVCHTVLVRVEGDDPRSAVELAYAAGYQTKIPSWPDIAPFSNEQWEETKVEVTNILPAVDPGDEETMVLPLMDVDLSEPEGVKARFVNPYPER